MTHHTGFFLTPQNTHVLTVCLSVALTTLFPPFPGRTAVATGKVRLEQLQGAAPQEESRAAAERAFAEAEQLHAKTNADSLRSAIEKYQEAITRFQAAGDPRRVGISLYKIGQIYDGLSEPRKARDYYAKALQSQRAVGDRLGEALTLNRLGSSHRFGGEQQKALEYYRQALELQRAEKDRAGESVTLNNFGISYSLVGELQKGIEYFEKALEIRREMGELKAVGETLGNIGVNYYYLGAHQQALGYYHQALQYKQLAGDRAGEATPLINIGVVYLDLGETQKAADYLNQGLKLCRELGNRRLEASALNNLGEIHYDLGEPRKALPLFHQALEIRQVLKDRLKEALTLNNVAKAYTVLGEAQKALEYYNQALQLQQAIKDRQGEAQTLKDLGFAYLALGELQKASDTYRLALALSRAVGNRAVEARTLYGLARVERERGNTAEARAEIEAALRIIESSRAKVAGQELRMAYLATNRHNYELHIDLLMRQHRQQPAKGYDVMALQASERSRARGLLDMLGEARADIRQGVDATLLERERTLQQRLNAKEGYRLRLQGGDHTKEQFAVVEKEVAELLARYQEVQAQIRTNSPRYAALIQPEPRSLREIQAEVLDGNTLLLEYSLGEEKSFLWAVTSDSINSFELTRRDRIEAAAQRVYELLTARNRRPEGETAEQRRARVVDAEEKYYEAAADLSRMVLGPAAPLIGTKRLLIVSDGALQYIPFAALPAPRTLQHGGDRRKRELYRPLIADHEVVSVPSASALAVLRQEQAGRKRAPKVLAVLADPVFSGGDVRMSNYRNGGSRPPIASAAETKTQKSIDAERSAEESGLISFTRLPFSRQEADAISSLVPEKNRMVALDFAAKREAVQDVALADYRIVHLATHGLLNSRHPELSGLVFSLVDEQGHPQDGFLRLHEIYNLKLEADLVVLSACQTALGKEVKGEGLIGITRGFMYAGAPRVAASLWRVDDRATAQLMKRFYQGMLLEGLRPAAALRAAQSSLRKEERWSSPYYWAAFVMQGEWR